MRASFREDGRWKRRDGRKHDRGGKLDAAGIFEGARQGGLRFRFGREEPTGLRDGREIVIIESVPHAPRALSVGRAILRRDQREGARAAAR